MTSINKRDCFDDGWPRPRRLVSGLSFRNEASGSDACGVTFVNSAAEIPDELWTAGFPPPLEGRWFYEALERSDLHGQFTFLYALISEGGVPVGVAPVFVTDVPVERVTPEKLLKPLRAFARVLPSILHQRTLFVGCPCSTEGAIGVLPGANRRAVLLALQKGLEKKARELNAELIVWKDVPPGISRDLDWLMNYRRLFRAVSLPGTVVKFSSQRKSDYFAQLKASRRKVIKKKIKLSSAEVGVDVQVLQHPAPEVLDEIFALFRQTYLKSKVKFEELSRTWFTRIAERQETYFIVLREKQTGVIIAFQTSFGCGSCLINKHVGFDYSKPKSWMLYFRLWDAVLDWALAKGYTSIYSGQTAYSAKLDMGHDLIPLVNYVQHRNLFLHLIYGRIARGLDWAKLDEGLALFLKAHPDAETTALPVPESRARAARLSLIARTPLALASVLPWRRGYQRARL